MLLAAPTEGRIEGQAHRLPFPIFAIIVPGLREGRESGVEKIGTTASMYSYVAFVGGLWRGCGFAGHEQQFFQRKYRDKGDADLE